MYLQELMGNLTPEIENAIVSLSYFIDFSMTVCFFIFKAIAIRTLAKNRGLDKLYLAWIPFFNYILLGKVVGTVFLFRKKVNNVGVIVTIATLFSFVVGTLINLGYYVNYLGSVLGFSITYESAFVTNWMSGQGVLYNVVLLLYYYVIEIASAFATAMLIFFVFRKYTPERAFLFTILSIIFDFMFAIFLFAIRDKKPSPYDEFFRTRVRVVRPHYEDTTSQYGKESDIDPFPEFSNGKSNLNGENNKNDDFFN